MADRSEGYMADRSEGYPFSILVFPPIPGLVLSPEEEEEDEGRRKEEEDEEKENDKEEYNDQKTSLHDFSLR